MPKPVLKEFVVSVKLNLDVAVTVSADSLEAAIVQVRELKPGDIVGLDDVDLNDYDSLVTGVFQN